MVHKRYLYTAFTQDQDLSMEFNNEFCVLMLAKEARSQHLVGLNEARLHPEHVSLEIMRYEMDLRLYLEKHRDHRKLVDILLQVASGLRELHELGFVHRDLKPENIVLNLRHPIKVALIDFNRALPTSNVKQSGLRGTPGYQPLKWTFNGGSIQWDIYSFVAIMLEANMGCAYFDKAAEEAYGHTIITKYLK